MRKWLNISDKNSEYSADSEDDGSFADSDAEFCECSGEPQIRDKEGDDFQIDLSEALPVSRRRKSETFRGQYINTKELRVSVSTWNVGGKLPPEDLNIDDWLDTNEPADIYVIGFQEIIPLNAGNIFGAEDNRPVSRWENIIRETLNDIQLTKAKYKCYSDPPSPSRFKPADDAPEIEDEVVLESDSESEDGIYPLNDSNIYDENKDGKDQVGKNVFPSSTASELERQFSSPKSLDRLHHFGTDDFEETEESSTPLINKVLTKMLSGTERIGLTWPEPPLDLLAQCVLDGSKALKSVRSFKTSKSFKTYGSFRYKIGDDRLQPEQALLVDLDLDAFLYRKRSSPYVRIVSKQMVGIFFTIWVRRSLRRCIQNLNVSTVGVGAMGYIGNKGSVSVSMSIYQTFFCFICTHLTAGEKERDVVKRNVDVREIHRRTQFNFLSNSGLPKGIKEHDRIIWLGDLNYRINLSYEKTLELISRKEWSKLVEHDQLVRELRKGRAFDGWSEGALNFAPTYKYELNSEKYYGEDLKVGRRIPAWCDRILTFGKGIRQVSYERSEIQISDHRPVTALYMVEVEVFSPRKLQRALTFTNAELEE